MWFHIDRERERERERFREIEKWNTVSSQLKEKRLVFCAALREKRKGDFSFAQDT